MTSSHTWLAFTPTYQGYRGKQTEPLGAHAFHDGADRSVCECVPRERTSGEEAAPEARRCIRCVQRLGGSAA